MTDRAALLLAYGGPDSLDDVGPYLADVRGGRPTPPELVEEVRSRYAVIGGGSPLLGKTREQATALRAALGESWRVDVGMRHWRPYIRDTFDALARRGVRRVVAVPMAPHYSSLSIGAYRSACEQAPAVARGDVELAFVSDWSAHEGFLDAVAERLQTARALLPQGDDLMVVFTAHSLPERILASGDPYADRVAASAAAVAARLDLPHWRVAFQSAGRSDEPWLGPEAGSAIEEAAAAGFRHVLITPIGFVCDHVEVLYDVDVAYRQTARSRGIGFSRTESLNASPRLIATLADLVRGASARAGWS